MRGCGAVLVAAGWTAVTLAFNVTGVLVLVGVAPPDENGASRPAVFAYFVLFMLPFDAVAAGLWLPIVRRRRQARRSTGVARVTAHPDGWRAVFPDDAGLAAAAAVVVFLPLAPLFLLPQWHGMRAPPAWQSGLVIGATVALAAAAYRRWHDPPVLLVNETDRTLALPGDDRQGPRTVSWAAVKGVWVGEPAADDEAGADPWYAVQVRTAGGRGPGVVRLPASARREPSERFAAWLRERIGDPAR